MDTNTKGKMEATLRGLSTHLGGDMASAEIARILRVPGTKNLKDKSNPVDVTIEEWGGQEYNLSDFEDYTQLPANSPSTSTDDVQTTVDEINKKCAFLAHAFKNKTLAEPLWFAMISNLARLSPGGRSLCHLYSQSYPGYSKEETDAKILHALDGAGPHTCRHIKQQGFDCGKDDCRVAAPVALIRKEEGRGRKKEEKKQYVYKALFPGLVDIVEDKKGQPSYLIYGNGFSLTKEHLIDGIECAPPRKEYLPFLLPRADEVRRWYEEDDDGAVFEAVSYYLSRFSYIDPDYRSLLTLFVFCSYIQDAADLYYLPEIVFFGPPENGKSRTGKAMTSIAYRGIHLADLREANVFRYAQNLQASLFFDTKDLWKKAERSGSEDLLLLRFEKGAKVSRVLYPERGPFLDMVHYNIFGPTIIATNEAIHGILDTRAINIPIPNKPGTYENLHPSTGLELKERLTAWRARMIGRPLPKAEPVPGVQGRLFDISEPLLQVCTLIYPAALTTLQKTLQAIAEQRSADKISTMEGQIVAWLRNNAPTNLAVWEIKTSELVASLNADRPDKYKLNPRTVGKKLKSMGITTRISRGTSTMTIRKDVLTDLVNAYRVEHSPNSPDSPPQQMTGLSDEVNDGEKGSKPPDEVSVVNRGLLAYPSKSFHNKGKSECGERGEYVDDDGVLVPEVMEGERWQS